MKEGSVIFLDVNDNALGKANYDRWNKLSWYKRLFGYFFYSYKHKFIDIQGFEVKDLKRKNFTIRHDGKDIEISGFKDLGNGSYTIEHKFL